MRASLVGRDIELSALSDASRRAAAGHGSVCLISGEPGIGKTRLVSQLGEDASSAGLLVLWGRCWEGGGAPALWPWVQVLRSYVDVVGVEEARRRASSTAARLRALVPDIDHETGDSGNTAPTTAEARFELFDAVVRLLRRASRDTPLVMILEDMHAADQASLLLLKFLSQQVASEPLLVAATFRDLEAEQSPEVLALLAEAGRAGITLPLRGLDEPAVAQMIRESLQSPSPDSLAPAVRDATSGNPFFVHELVRLLRTEQRVDDVDLAAQLRVPGAVSEVLQRRLQLLPTRARPALEAAAVLGREFRTSVVAQVTGISAAQVREDIAAAQSLGVVREVQSPLRYAFSHALMRSAVYELIGADRRATLHAAAAETLWPADVGGERAAEVAHHALNAVEEVGARRCIEALTAAGDHALEVLAYEQAAAAFSHAADLAAEHDATARPTDLLLKLATAQLAAGDVDAARRTCLQAAEGARASNDAPALAAAALIFGEPGLQGGLVNEQLVELLEEALQLLPDEDSSLRCRILARLALELYFSDDSAQRREVASSEALAMSSRLGEPEPRAAALRARFMASWTPDNAEERLALVDELKDLARRSRDAQLRLHASARRITCLLELGRVAEMDAEIESHRVASEELRQPFHVWTSKTMLAMRALLEGRFDDTERLATEAYQLGWERMQQPNAIFAYYNQMLSMAFERGSLGEQVETLRGLADGFPRLRALRALYTVALIHTGRLEDAQVHYASMVEAFPQWPRDSNWLHAAGWLAECVWLLRDAAAAADVYDALEPHARRIEMAGMPHPVSFWGSASRPLALMATVLQRWDAADRHFTDALQDHRRLGARPYVAHVQAEWAQMLLERRSRDDEQGARQMLNAAHAAAQSMGMALLAFQTASLLAGMGRSAAAAGPAAGPDAAHAQLRREGDVWAVIYTGGEFRIKSTRGLEHIAYLLQRPGEEVLAMDLYGGATSRGVTPPHDDALHHGGSDALGATLDPEAKRAYQRRLEDLREELADAEQWGDPERAAKAQDEIDALAHELAAAIGLGGRDRTMGSTAERARIAVTKAVRGAIKKVTDIDPLVGRYLSGTIRTGTFCSYTPDPGNSLLSDFAVA